MKSDEIPDTIYADIESLIRKIDGCANNTEHFSTTKIGEHIHCGYSMSNFCAFDHIENRHIYIAEKTVWESFVNL